MKQIIYNIISWFTKIQYLYSQYISTDKGICWRHSFHGYRDNKIILKNAKLYHTKLLFSGRNSKVCIKGICCQCKIEVYGDGNIVNIDSCTELNFTRIIVRGANCNVTIGAGTRIGSSYMICMGKSNSIIIGEDCMFSENVEIWSSDTHPIFNNGSETITNPSKPIFIGNHVWLGKYAVVLKGVEIGDNAVVGMKSLVTRDIRRNTLNVGIPATPIKENINWNRSFISNFE